VTGVSWGRAGRRCANDRRQELAADEERRVILDELSRHPTEQRRAFMPHVLEGWPTKDIAAAHRRPGEQVREDIEAVKRVLRERLQRVVA
jgi:DNA-directed RNA polymerase specialized sigma24 family protein